MKHEWLAQFSEGILSACFRAGKLKMFAGTIVLVGIVAAFDWLVGNTVSLAVLYIIPMMVGAIVFSGLELAALALVCALLRARFDVPASQSEVILRFVFAFFAFLCSGFFVTALVQNRQLALEHITEMEREQSLRHEAEEQLRTLVESSPAAILTLDEEATVVAANNAANALFGMDPGEALRGKPIGLYLPVLSDALGFSTHQQEFRTSAQCQGRRHNGELFLANTWFSSYATAKGARLAAIVVDSSEEMRDREEQGLQQLLTYNRIAAAAISHEVRNVCGAISLLSTNLRSRQELARDEDFQALLALIEGLEKIASFQLTAQAQDTPDSVSLQEVLDTLRIIVDAEWTEIDGLIRWPSATELPHVVADPHGLLQALLNLVHNSWRAVQESPRRELTVTIISSLSTTIVRLEDSGPGVSRPDLLFQPFHPGADGTGLGLYISRALVRSYGGDVRWEKDSSASFLVELQNAG